MIKNEYNVVGIMSGTSLDGIDLALINFKFEDSWTFKIITAETVDYTKDWTTKLKTLVNYTKQELRSLDIEYTAYLANTINVFLEKNNIFSVDAICSHGHTALHKPENKLTYQIGNLPSIAKITNQLVVCDFRVQDVELGGQGAPLVPIGDELLFSNYTFCINLGGFANISTALNKNRIAFDICPLNIVLNKYVSNLGFDFDDKGEIAKSGSINKALLKELNALPFYKKNHPKSLGLEWVNKNIFPLIDSYKLSTPDILRTFVEHIVMQIETVINTKTKASILLTGGGVFNSFLINRINSRTNNKIEIPSKEIIEFKEALIFGFLGVLKLRNQVNCLASVTGAKKNHVSGVIFHP
ncbi:anhydro-N-acetylmuramic acid kinase [Lacinutrix sp. MedPE-SW]|uniref:anhydro-N-acetylmuramic acid kinase n=1 Tax=Lacinutrix sp. MedPE-SW TaxID=1860087 RepID=UPI000916E12C|nr:anhydro-N-acetylmuramic acid kinase [Lacinutrix sp. MedPE-SW]OIQ18846.1 MAG: anhydro-N-acetylmuramic acid kinase [Lacinutrix sp. MedPE-SW]